MKNRHLLFSVCAALLAAGVGYGVASWKNSPEMTNAEPLPATRIALISDIDRCETRSFATPENMNRFVRFANEQSVDFAVSLGDNIAHRLELCSETATEDLDLVLDTFSALTMPMHYVLGDHDLSDDPTSYALWLEKTARERTYYSFDNHDVKVIVLDTITGGSSMLECEDDMQCSKLSDEITQLRTENDVETTGKKQRFTNEARIISLEQAISAHDARAEYISDAGVRDHGLLSQAQLLWLAHELTTTEKPKVLILSDHPLFNLTTIKKSYDIDGLAEVQQILEDATVAGKQVVSVGGEVHKWDHESINGVAYYTLDQFRSKDGSWGYAKWDDNFLLHKVRDDQIGDIIGSTEDF